MYESFCGCSFLYFFGKYLGVELLGSRVFNTFFFKSGEMQKHIQIFKCSFIKWCIAWAPTRYAYFCLYYIYFLFTCKDKWIILIFVYWEIVQLKNQTSKLRLQEILCCAYIYIYSLFDKQAHLNPSHFLVAEFLLCLNMLFLWKF